MSEPLTQRLIVLAITAVRRHNKLNARIHGAFEARYGIDFSAIDEDALIDIFDYGQANNITLKQCDNLMSRNGYPPLKNGDRHG